MRNECVYMHSSILGVDRDFKYPGFMCDLMQTQDSDFNIQDLTVSRLVSLQLKPFLHHIPYSKCVVSETQLFLPPVFLFSLNL